MEKEEFLERFRSEVDRDDLHDLMYDEFAMFCRENNISEEEISNDELMELARGFVKRGLKQ